MGSGPAMKRNGTHPAPIPIWLTIEERDVLVRALWRTPCPNDGYREFLSAIQKLKGDR